MTGVAWRTTTAKQPYKNLPRIANPAKDPNAHCYRYFHSVVTMTFAKTDVTSAQNLLTRFLFNCLTGTNYRYRCGRYIMYRYSGVLSTGTPYLRMLFFRSNVEGFGFPFSTQNTKKVSTLPNERTSWKRRYNIPTIWLSTSKVLHDSVSYILSGRIERVSVVSRLTINHYSVLCTSTITMVKRIIYNLVPLLIAQLLFLAAVSLSSLTVWDCQFVILESSNVGNFLQSLEITTNDHHMTKPNINSTTHGVGFFLWEGIDGKCALQESDNADVWYHLYQEFLGPDWYIPRIMASMSLAVSFVVLICTFIYTCVSHLKLFQYTLVFVLLAILPILQSIPFVLVRSDFCKTYDCYMGRTAHYGMGAIVLYVATGLLLLLTVNNNHPQEKDIGSIEIADDDPEQWFYPIKIQRGRIRHDDKKKKSIVIDGML
jgi:hypothetical protein